MNKLVITEQINKNNYQNDKDTIYVTNWNSIGIFHFQTPESI